MPALKAGKAPLIDSRFGKTVPKENGGNSKRDPRGGEQCKSGRSPQRRGGSIKLTNDQ